MLERSVNQDNAETPYAVIFKVHFWDEFVEFAWRSGILEANTMVHDHEMRPSEQ